MSPFKRKHNLLENRQRLKPQHTTKRTSGLPKQTRTKMQTRKHNIRKNIQILPIHTNMQQMPKKKQKNQRKTKLTHKKLGMSALPHTPPP